MKTLIIGSDHAGFATKEFLKKSLQNNYRVIDLGTDSIAPVDYPVIARKVATAVVRRRCLGLLVCGTGIGMHISANKVRGVRAAQLYSNSAARLAREHNHANIGTLQGRGLSKKVALRYARRFLASAPSALPRHVRRVRSIEGSS